MLEYCPMRVKENGNCSPMGGFCQPDTEICKALHAAYESGTFNAGVSASNQPTIPLTLEQLREMDGEPVFIKCLFNDELSSYVVVDKRRDSAGIFTRLFYASFDYYGDEWLAYRHRPE